MYISKLFGISFVGLKNQLACQFYTFHLIGGTKETQWRMQIWLKKIIINSVYLFLQKTETQCSPEINRLPDISPANMGLFRISRELKFGVSNHGEPHTSFHTAREGKQFYREEQEIRRVIVNQEFTAFHWLSPYQARSVSSPC